MDGEAFNVDSQQIGAGGGEREPRIVPLVGSPRGAQIRYSNWSMDPATEWQGDRILLLHRALFRRCAAFNLPTQTHGRRRRLRSVAAPQLVAPVFTS